MEILFITDKGEGLSLAYTLAHYGHKVRFFTRQRDYERHGAGIIELTISWKPYALSADIVVIGSAYGDTLDRNFPNAVILRDSVTSKMVDDRIDRALILMSTGGGIPTLPYTTYESPDMAQDLKEDFPEHGVRILNNGYIAKDAHEYMYYLQRLPSVAPVLVSPTVINTDWIHVTTLDWYNNGK